jgi:urease accessory protein
MPETYRAVSVVRSGDSPGTVGFDLAVLAHDERRIRRRLITLVHGDTVLVDFKEPVTLHQHDMLRLEDGRHVDIVAAEELLYEVRARDPKHLMQLCWHIGNRHAKAQIDNEWEGIGERILILRDHVLRDMLRGLGATVTEVSEPFSPLDGAYAHAHGDAPHALLAR